jgi:hypothetical protein
MVHRADHGWRIAYQRQHPARRSPAVALDAGGGFQCRQRLLQPADYNGPITPYAGRVSTRAFLCNTLLMRGLRSEPFDLDSSKATAKSMKTPSAKCGDVGDMSDSEVVYSPPFPACVTYVRYVASATIAGLANIATQQTAVRAVPVATIAASILVGTAVYFGAAFGHSLGNWIKHLVSKRYVFQPVVQ